jgi:adenine deaminase
MQLTERIFAGKGDIKADTVLEHCRIINVNTKEILNADIAIQSGYIVGIGDVSGLRDANTRIIDVNHSYVSPGLLDGHVHFESSMVTLSRFARKALEHGTTGIVIDPHEIANILGRQGIELVLEEAKSLPLNIFVAVSSCVPATPFETSGASLDAADVRSLIDNEMVVGLGEVMDFPGVLGGDAGKLALIQAARERRLVVDGHAPGLMGPDLWGYMAAGISSDHESLTYEEALEKLRLGMKLMLREGSAAKCLENFLPRLLEEGISLENVFFVTDDKHPEDLLAGYMDVIVRKAIALGLDPLDAISMCTINTARHYRIDHLVGSISIGCRADLVILDDLEEFSIHSVIAGGAPITPITPIGAQTPVFNYRDYGKKMENVVFLELERRKRALTDIFYWKNPQQEGVDFVVLTGGRVEQLIQVCRDVDDANVKKREVRALVKASDQLECDDLLVITGDYDSVEEHKGKSIRFIPLWMWLTVE